MTGWPAAAGEIAECSASMNNAGFIVIKRGRKRVGEKDIDLLLLHQSKAKKQAEVMEAWTSKNAHHFWNPVDLNAFPTYSLKVSSPNCLPGMLGKLARMEYTKSDELIRYFELMVSNSEIFNGTANVVSSAARNLQDNLRTNLQHERVHLGADKDSAAILEQAVAQDELAEMILLCFMMDLYPQL
eukprot:gene29973-36202_t